MKLLGGNWFKPPLVSELEIAEEDLELIRHAGELSSMADWRYGLLPSILYAIGRSFIYCIRHRCLVFAEKRISDTNKPIYIHFYPICEAAIKPLKLKVPGITIGFTGNSCSNFPLLKLAFAVVVAMCSQSVRQYITKRQQWRPWISSLIIYVLLRRWGEDLFGKLAKTTVVFSHDHSPFEKALVRSANSCGHTSVYIQHASVTDIFPPLFASYSLLDGLQAADTYLKIGGGSGKAIVTGRQYGLTQRAKPASDLTPMICTSPLDTEEVWIDVVRFLKAKNFSIRLRPHPADRRIGLWQDFSNKHNILFEDSKKTNLKSAMASSNMVFAGASNVLLEAALSGCLPVQVEFTANIERGLADYYGFIKQGIALAVYPSTIESDLERVLATSMSSQFLLAASYYDAASVCLENYQESVLRLIVDLNGDVSGPDLNAVDFIRVNSHDVSVNGGGFECWVPNSVISSCANSMWQ